MNKMIALMLALLTAPAFAAREQNEAFYQDHFCERVNGRTEYVLTDLARVDCLTLTHAWEVDFASKWAEGIGQALYYASMTKRMAGLVIIVEDASRDERYLRRIDRTIEHYGFHMSVVVVTWDEQRGFQAATR